MSVRQVWKRKTSTPKSSPFSQNESPPFPPRVHLQYPSPPSYNLYEINDLTNFNTSPNSDSHITHPNAYIHAPLSPLPQPIHHPSHAQGLFYKKNVDYAELIWEDCQYQIDYRQTSVRRREIMPYLRFTKVIIHHFHSKYKSISKRHGLFMNLIKDDGVLGRLKFVSKGEYNQVYGMSIPDVMVNNDIKNSKAYQTYLAISTGIVVPNKARKGMKTTAAPKKKGSITADDNINHDPKEVLKLGKSISRTEAEEQEEGRRVLETHECLVTKKSTSDVGSDESGDEQEGRLTGRRPTGVIIRDTPNVSIKKILDQSQKLKGIEMLSDAAQLVVDTQKAIKANILKRKSKGSSEGAGITPKAPDEPKGKSVTQDDDWGSDEEEEIISSDDERTESEKEVSKSEKADEETADEEEVHSDEEVHTEEDQLTDDEHYDEKHDDVDKEMNDAENVDEAKYDQEMVDAEKVDSEKTKAEKVDNEIAGTNQAAKDAQAGALGSVTHNEKRALPPSTSSLYMSSDYGNQFLNLSFDVSLVENSNTNTNTTTNPPTTTKTHAIVVSVPDLSPTVFERLSKLEKKVESLSKVDQFATIEASVQANVINEVKNQLPKLLPKAVSDFVNPIIESTVHDVLQKDPINLEQHDSQKDALEIRKIKLEHASKQ
ncbi:hypothetical protein Tco_0725503 [Tanacetum coccineum]|uniref:Uncharacterized protein n=1 Tax=Tanacetum coccineum TaxID=301880 RepID=A0ABQ4YFA0_9ASTR